MRSRIISAAALASIIAAAGCGGGGSGTSALGGLAPKAPPAGGGTTTSSKGRVLANINATVKIPLPFKLKGTTSSGRSAQYLSPGTGNFDVLLGNCGASSSTASTQSNTIVTDNGTGGPVAPIFTIGIVPISSSTVLAVGNTLHIVDTTSTPGNTYTSSTFTITSIGGAGTLLTGRFTDTTGTQQIPTGAAPAALTFPHNFPIGAAINIVGAPASNQTFIVGSQTTPQPLTTLSYSGSVPQSVSGVAGSTYTINGVSNTSPGSGLPGFYTMNVQIKNISAAAAAPGTKYCLGIVTLDSGNFVLSEAQQEFDIPNTGGTVETAFTLKPVVSGFVAAPPTLVVPGPLGSGPQPIALIPNQTGNGANPNGGPLDISYNSYSTVLFATDHAGYIIPDVGTANNNSVPANSTVGQLPAFPPAAAGPFAPFVSITQTSATTPVNVEYIRNYNNIFFAGPGLPTTPPTAGVLVNETVALTGAATSATFSPIGSVTLGGSPQGDNGAFSANQRDVFGGYVSSVLDPAPSSIVSGVDPASGALTSANFAGTPLNIVCAAQKAGSGFQANVFFTKITGTTTASPAFDNTGTGDVSGFTFTPGTNIPAVTTLATPFVQQLGTVDCTPGLGAVVN